MRDAAIRLMVSPLTPPNPGDSTQDVARAMKTDWDARARENAKWYINTVKRTQTDEEFDEGGRREVDALILADLPFLTRGRDPRSLRFLEIGCGLGRMTRVLAGYFGEVHATDVSGEMIRGARKRLSGLSNVVFHETNGLDCRALPEQSVDVIFSVYVFQHIPSAEAIRSNIVDGYRVLRPGGLMKFQTMDFSNEEFSRLPKDTWAGAAFTESQLRQTARELGAQLLEISGKRTQYCWTTLGRRVTSPAAPRSNAVPRILEAGRWDDRSIRSVAAAGDDARISILASRCSLGDLDAGAIEVILQDQRIEPDYVGPVSRRWPSSGAADTLELIVCVPGAVLPGPAEIRVQVGDHVSAPFPLTIVAAPWPRLVITGVQNGADGGLDIEVSGPKSILFVTVDGFDRAPARGDVRLHIDDCDLEATLLDRIPGKGGYVARFQLPTPCRPGRHELQACFGDQESPVHSFDVGERRMTTLADLTPSLDDAAAVHAQGLSHAHPLFSADYYRQRYQDVAQADANPLVHYVRSGAAEGRDPHPLFDTRWYLGQCRGAMPPGMSPLTHYITVGVHLGLDPHPLFATPFYRKQVPDLDVRRMSPLAHYLAVGWRQGLDPHALFCAPYFRERCGGLLPEGVSPLEFYLTSSAAIGIDPHRWFSASHYLTCNPDVAASGMNPLLHFVVAGAAEGRSPHPDFDLRSYRRRHADRMKPRVNPLVHFLEEGTTEGAGG